MENSPNLGGGGATGVSGAAIALPKTWDLLKESIAFYKTIARRMFEVAEPTVALGLVYFILLAFGEKIPVLSTVALLVGIVATVFYVDFCAATTFLIIHPENAEGAKELRARGWKYFWPWVWVRVLSTLVSLGGFVLFIIPGIVISIRLMFSQFVLFAEEKRGLAALSRSWSLMMGNGWRVFGRTFLFGIIVGVAYIVFSVVVGIIGGILKLFIGEPIVTFLGSVPMFVSWFVLVPLSSIFIYKLYYLIAAARGATDADDIKYAKRSKIFAWLSPIAFLIIIGIIAFVVVRFGGEILKNMSTDMRSSLGADSRVPFNIPRD